MVSYTCRMLLTRSDLVPVRVLRYTLLARTDIILDLLFGGKIDTTKLEFHV